MYTSLPGGGRTTGKPDSSRTLWLSTIALVFSVKRSALIR